MMEIWKYFIYLFLQDTLNTENHIDTYPDISNYKNLLSIGGTSKPRPTLFELQVEFMSKHENLLTIFNHY